MPKRGRAGLLLLPLIALLASCQVRLERLEETPLQFSLGHFENRTLYHGAEVLLEEALVQELNRRGIDHTRGPQLNGTLVEAEKRLLEKDEFGFPTELQFDLKVDLVLELDGERESFSFSNLERSPVSSIHRPYDGISTSDEAGIDRSEDLGLQAAVQTLAQQIVHHLEELPFLSEGSGSKGP